MNDYRFIELSNGLAAITVAITDMCEQLQRLADMASDLERDNQQEEED